MTERVLERPGKRVILLGNEAVVRGALESGIGFASAYPGTPSSEIADTFSKIAKKVGIYFEYSTNEKVALEAAGGAAFAGVRSIVSFKHFGLNVASDSVQPLAYHGLKAGMVIAVADDPGCWSSGQSEQDTRFYARMMHMPMLEPADPQECKDFCKLAFWLSERFKIPCFLRLTTRVSHASADVKLGRIVKGRTEGIFKKGDEFRNMPPEMLKVHEELHKKLDQIEKWAEKQVKLYPGKGELGIVTLGAPTNYVLESLERLKLDLPVLKLNLSYPIPRGTIQRFARNLKKIFVIEELEPVIQQELQRLLPGKEVIGKEILPRAGELKPETVERALAKVFGLKVPDLERSDRLLKGLKLVSRKPTLCPGCPHRASFWELKAALGDAVWGGDIGCYILGIYPPQKMQDWIISMGATQGISHGLSKTTKQKIVSILGDSTFFHAGIPGLINMVYNQSDVLVAVLDNFYTAMTGHQPHPGTGCTGMQEKSKKLDIAEIAKACGVENVAVVNVWNVKQAIRTIKRISSKPGPKLLVMRGECRLQFMRRMRKEGIKTPVFEIDPEKCRRCGLCVYQFGCPAIHHDRKKNLYWIDPDYCWGCAVCSQVCPYGAIKVRK